MFRSPLRFEPLEQRDVPVTVFIWDGGGTDQLWSTDANWVGDAAPTAATADPTGVVIQFNGGAQSSMDIDGLTVDQVALVGNGNRVTIRTGTALRLNGGVLADNVVSTGTGNVLDNEDPAPISTSELELVGTAPVFRSGAGADLTVQALVTGTTGITKLGAGDFTLRNRSVSRSFSGPVNLTEGTTTLAQGVAVQDSLTIGAGARVVVTSLIAFDELGPSGQTYNGQPIRHGTAVVRLAVGARLEFPNGGVVAMASLAGDPGSTVVLSPNTRLFVGYPPDPAQDILFEGAITGAGEVNYANLGTWTLSGPNTFDGYIRVIAGTLRAGAADALSGEFQIFLNNTTLDLNDFDQTIRGVDELIPNTATSTAQILLGSATLTIHLILPESTYRGAISGTGGLTVTGTGRLSLFGDLDYTGPTVVRDGAILNVNGRAFTNVTLSQSQLNGNGTMGNVGSQGGGTIGPGNSPGRLTIGSLTLGATDTITVELNGTAAGMGYDQLVARGPVQLTNTRLDVRVGFAAAPGTSFTILSNQSGQPVTGGFAGLPEGTEFTANGVRLRISYRGGAGNDVVLTVPGGPGQTGRPKSDGAFAFRFGPGGPPIAALFNADGSPRFVVLTAGGGGATAGDVTGDGISELIVAGPGGLIQIYSGTTGAVFTAFFALPGYPIALNVGAGDIDGDGIADIVVAPTSGLSFVVAFNGRDFKMMSVFLPFGPVVGGLRVASDDLNRDGFADIYVAPLGFPVFAVFSGRDQSFLGIGTPSGGGLG